MFSLQELRLRRLRLWKGVLAAALVGSLLHCVPVRAAPPPDEVALGKEAAEELEKQYKVLKDEAMQARLEKIGRVLAEIANEVQVEAVYGSPEIKKFEYTFKILDDDDVNALSMPGGFIYVNKGLMEYAQSDDELAGVVAHEIAHISHHHMMSLIKEQAKSNNQLAVVLLAAILSGAPATDMGNLMMGARFVQIAVLNGYSRQAEDDADRSGLEYLVRSSYNPVGMLTFMERLARDELGRPSINWGVYQTHPFAAERSRVLASLLKEKNIRIDRRAVTAAAVAEVRKAEKAEGVYEVWIDGSRFFTFASERKSSEERAREMAAQLNGLLDSGLRMRDIRQTPDPPGVLAKGQILVQVTPEDAALDPAKTPQKLAEEAYGVLYKVLFKQELENIF